MNERQDQEHHDNVRPIAGGRDHQALDSVGAVAIDQAIAEERDHQALDSVGAVAIDQAIAEERDHQALDSVGAVAIDQGGRLACANSTG